MELLSKFQPKKTLNVRRAIFQRIEASVSVRITIIIKLNATYSNAEFQANQRPK